MTASLFATQYYTLRHSLHSGKEYSLGHAFVFSILFYVMCMGAFLACTPVYHVCVVPVEARRGCLIPVSCHVDMGNEFGSSGKISEHY